MRPPKGTLIRNIWASACLCPYTPCLSRKAWNAVSSHSPARNRVTCNSKFKFEYLLDRAHAFGARRVASGHYARIDVDPDTGLWRLRRAIDTNKDQTYFPFELTQAQLGSGIFPLA